MEWDVFEEDKTTTFFGLFRAVPMPLEVPRLWVKLELQLLVTPQPQPRGTLATSVTFTIAHGNARSPTH